jgi:molybdopterin molybdotransferase
MTAFTEALRIARESAVRGEKTAEVDITAATGYVLAETVFSDIDMPPFDRAMMDGFAVRRPDVACEGSLRIAGSIAAGDPPGPPFREGECVRIMTGAPLPRGADTVIPLESVEEADGRVRFPLLPLAGAHVSPKGEDVRAGDLVLRAGSLLGPQEIGILAAVGRPSVRIYAPPSVAYVATGDELVEPGEKPGPGQIRNSNAYTLHVQIIEARGIAYNLGVVRDRESDLKKKIEEGLRHDMLLLSGGVSKGRHDLVPALLAACGVQIRFRGVDVKPGYPTLFGARGRTLVCGLAGNPIAALFGFELYVRPAIRAFFRHPRPEAVRHRGELTEGIGKKTGRAALVPCLTEWAGGRILVTPVRTHGSADIFAVAGADSIAILPSETDKIARGEEVEFFRMGER